MNHLDQFMYTALVAKINSAKSRELFKYCKELINFSWPDPAIHKYYALNAFTVAASRLSSISKMALPKRAENLFNYEIGCSSTFTNPETINLDLTNLFKYFTQTVSWHVQTIDDISRINQVLTNQPNKLPNLIVRPALTELYGYTMSIQVNILKQIATNLLGPDAVILEYFMNEPLVQESLSKPSEEVFREAYKAIQQLKEEHIEQP